MLTNQTRSSTGIQPMETANILIIDDDESMREACRQTLEAESWHAEVAGDGEKGLEIMRQVGADVVLLDLKMPGMSGMDVLSEIPQIDTSTSVIVITGYGTIDTAVDAMKTGATDFLAKPFEPVHLVERVRRGIDLSQSRKKKQTIEPEVPSGPVTAEAKPRKKQHILLKGLEALGEYRSLGMEKRNFFEELKYLEAEARYHTVSYDQTKKAKREILHVIKALRKVEEIIAKHDNMKSALIQILLDVQRELNWLPRYVLKWVSACLNIPLANVDAITNFYEAFNLEPRGAHLLQVCEGTACHVRGAPELLAKVSSLCGIGPGETRSDGMFTLKTVHCMGCCALGPVVKVNDQYFSNPSTRGMNKVLGTLEKQEKAS